MTNSFSIQNFLLHARKLRAEGSIKIKRSTYGGCTELRCTLSGTTDSVALYKGARGGIRCAVAFSR